MYSEGPHLGDHEAMLGDTKGLENRDARAGTVSYENKPTKTERQKGEQEANLGGLCQRLKKQYPIEVQKQGYLLQWFATQASDQGSSKLLNQRTDPHVAQN